MQPVPDRPLTKQDLRSAHHARRADRSEAEQGRLACGLRDQLLALPEVAAATQVASFVSQGGEPGTRPFIDALHAEGVEVLLPILGEDFDLDWGRYEPGAQQPGRFAILVPTTEPRGREAIAGVDVVVCPGVAVDRSGHRLGRGGGSYDRALSRCGPDVLRVQVVYDDEVVDGVPVDDHDEPVQVIVTPTTTIRVRSSQTA